MAVRIGQVSIAKVEGATDGVPTDISSAAIDCSVFPNARAIISALFIRDDLGNPVTINSWRFDPGVSNQNLAQIGDANSDGLLLYASLQNPTAISAVVTANATSSGANWNGILATLLLYEVAQAPDAVEAVLNDYAVADTDAHIVSEPSNENQLHINFVAVDSTDVSTEASNFSPIDGSFPWLYQFIDPLAGGRLLNMLVCGINGDQYANREINVTWDTGGRGDYWAFDLLVNNFKQLHVDIPGAVGVPGHILVP